MTPSERARRLRQALQGSFRIDLFSVVAERTFERLIAEAIQAAEHDAVAALRRPISPSGVAGRPDARPPSIP
ncbi:hypothetical protein [Azospirillum sp. TSO22-1]|uniref:hypothetical protein n=1 Tax=Azospirillum sp. TSO22-1 TaxID=716789 RepID=UPI0011B758C6|nr:hypothetical protein [Azospirillum sp. TSO22-1]